jgi:NAD(P)-dependent dehydrogenase (short-subunit alcohol dehydrogenase family)
MNLPGKVLITGGGKRAGAVIARKLASAGWGVVIHYQHSRDAAEKLAGELGCETIAADLSNQTDVQAMSDSLSAKGWRGVVHSAATFVPDEIDTFTYDNALSQLRPNLLAPVLLGKNLKQHLSDDQRGFLISISDQKVFNPNPDYLSYTLTKIALTHATDTLAMALAPKVRVCCVVAGLMLPSGDQTPEQFARVHDQTVLHKGNTPEDVANAVAYLASAEAITGAIVHVDGGQHLVRSARDVMFT